MLLSTLAADFEEAEAADAPGEKQRPCSKPCGSIAVDRDVKWAKSTRIRSFSRFLGVRGHPHVCVPFDQSFLGFRKKRRSNHTYGIRQRMRRGLQARRVNSAQRRRRRL